MPGAMDCAPYRLERADVLAEVAAGPVPAAVARRERLVALRRDAIALVRDQGLLAARGCWRLAALQAPACASGRLELDGGRLQAPWLLPQSGRLTGVACAVATLGEAIEQRVAALFAQRRASLAVALDALANELLFALARRLQDRVLGAVRKQRLSLAGELRPGDPGLDLQAQQTVLDLAGAAAIDVRLSAGLMMAPTKSTAIVHGVGVDLPHQTWSRCDHCPSRARCALVNDPAYARRARPAPAAGAPVAP